MDRNFDRNPDGTSASGGEPVNSLQITGEQEARDTKGRFAPGPSGNPSGRPPGSRNRSGELPLLAEANDATNALAAIVKGVATGDLTAAEAGHLSAVVDRFVHSLEARQLEERLTAVEARHAALAKE